MILNILNYQRTHLKVNPIGFSSFIFVVGLDKKFPLREFFLYSNQIFCKYLKKHEKTQKNMKKSKITKSEILYLRRDYVINYFKYFTNFKKKNLWGIHRKKCQKMPKMDWFNFSKLFSIFILRMSYSAITFRSHLNDKFLDEEFLTLLMPILNKSPKFVLSVEERGTLSQHYHICFEFNEKSDRSHLIQKFKTKNWKSWYQRIKNEQFETIIDPQFKDHCLQIKVVEKDPSDHNLQKWIGYCCKDDLQPKIKGFDEEYITQSIKYYHLNQRIESSKKPDYGWRYIKPNTAHAVITEWCEKHEVDIKDFNYSMLAYDKISSVQMTQQQKKQVISELYLANTEEMDEFTKKVHEYEVNGYSSEVNPMMLDKTVEVKVLKEYIQKLESKVLNLKNQLNNK